ncbi:MAG: response regulator [Flavobacterium psychrophilum]|nr:MAG: response regulator [Flavobacterium psychrophilum]
MTRILLIDDDRDDRDFFTAALSRLPHEVQCTTLENGHALLPKLAQGAIDRPDVIFLDVNVPEMSGWECLNLIKAYENFKNIPVIMYSTSKHQEDILRARTSGALCFFTKPYAIAELREALTDVVSRLEKGNIENLARESPLFF